MYSMSTTRHK